MNKLKFKRASLLGILLLAVLLLSVSVSSAQEGGGDLTPAPDGITEGSTMFGTAEKDDSSVPTTLSRSAIPAENLEVVSIIVTFDDTVDAATLEEVSGGTVVHNFSKLFNGVSIVVAGDSVNAVAAIPGVNGIYLDQLQQPTTENSPEYIGATTLWNFLGGQESAGEGVTVGVLDTGVWPEHPSYSDPDPYGKVYAAPSVAPGSNGFAGGIVRNPCDFGDVGFNPNDAPFTCNNKLIGAYDFTDTYKAVVGLLPAEFNSARDADGHGTHTSSTAAGNGGVTASVLGSDLGIVSGIAPRAYVIMYKVCGNSGCFGSDSAAAVEQAILDEVDAINFSISGGGDPYNDVVEQMFAIAYDNGVFVAASAGNSGPGPDTVAHRGPWTTTVAASTQNRTFQGEFTLSDGVQADLTVTGVTVTGGYSAEVVDAADYGDAQCLTPFSGGTFNGEIVLCQRGLIARVAKSFNVAEGGAGGMVLYNPVAQGLSADNHYIPSLHIGNDEGVDVLAFMAAATTPVTGTLSGSMAVESQGHVMASFSSRGGPNQTLGVSKPDITAPGVEILAGNTPLPASVSGGAPGNYFQVIQGTSMSSPHIAGSAALMAALHPDWTPGQIKSALMMTADTEVAKEDGATAADAFDYGSGYVNLNKSGFPPFTISDSTANFMALEDELWNANYPSLYIPVMPGLMTVERTLNSERPWNMWYRTSIDAPDDLNIDIAKWIKVPGDGEKTIEITVDAHLVPIGETRFATITFKSWLQELTFPVTIVRRQADITIDQTCDPVDFAKYETTDCTINITNTTFDSADFSVINQLSRELKLDKDSLVGADVQGSRQFTAAGTLTGAQSPDVFVAEDPLASPFGYLSIAGFNPIAVNATDESITNFNVPAFEFAGEIYSQIGIVSNGYIVVGGGTGADVDYINSDLPNAAPPNNVLAPFWTDLNPDAGGRVIIQLITNSIDSWIVVEWESVPNWGDGETNTFQVWIGYTQPDDVSFVYGADISDGDGGFLTVGAENKFGNSGGTVYFDGVGTPPSPSYSSTNPTGTYEVDVYSVPGVPGETYTITYTAKGKRTGEYYTCAGLTSPVFQGTSAACAFGEITNN